MLKFATFASGSTGNCAAVSDGRTHILLDAGISARQISAGLRSLAVEPTQLSAVLVTHEHSDHISGLPVLSKNTRVPIYATGPTCRACCKKGRCGTLSDLMVEQEAGTGVQIGSLWVESFPTPHDAAGSVGYSISGDGGRMVLCTDLGHVTEEVLRAVKGCDLLVCETNHDETLLKTGPYPYFLKKRILGDHGHLSNEAGAELAAAAVESGAKTVVLAHLSRQNNTPALAYEAVCRRLAAMGCDPQRDISLTVAPCDAIGEVCTVGKVSLC